MTRALLEACGIHCGYVGTLGASYGEWTRGLQNTTPLPIELQETLATMFEMGAKAVAMEVSSHALQRESDLAYAGLSSGAPRIARWYSASNTGSSIDP